MTETYAVLVVMFTAFPNSNATPETIIIYAKRLADIPLNELEAIVNQCIDECEFLPTIAKIKEMHRQMLSDISVDKGAEGWLAVQRAMLDPVNYTPEPNSFVPKFKDPIVRKVVEAMGWWNLRTSENQMADRSQFLRFYESFTRRELANERLSAEYKQLRDMRQEGNSDNGSPKRLNG